MSWARLWGARFPAASDTRTAVQYGPSGNNTTGTCAVPKAGDTRSGVAVDATTGTLQLPSAQFVVLNVGYGEDGFEFIGQFHVPATSDVRATVGYGALGIEYIGDLALPSATRVIDGVVYDSPSSQQTGNFTYPTEVQVLSGVTYGANGTEFTGTLQPGGSVTVPAITDVRTGVAYGTGNSLVGVLVSPQESEVLFNVGYGANGTEYVGTLQPINGGGAGSVWPPVSKEGYINSPLFTDVDYLSQHGMGFTWVFDFPSINAQDDSMVFRGRKIDVCDPPCNATGDYDWSVDGTLTPVSGGVQASFDLPANTVAESGMYQYWIIWSPNKTNEVVLLSGQVEFKCG